MSTNIAGAEIRQGIEQVEHLEAERRVLAEAIKDRFAGMKSRGFDVAAIKIIIKERAADPDKLAETEAVVEMYKSAIGAK